RPSLLFPSWLVAIDTTSPADQLEHITRTPETLTKLWNHFATAVRREQADCRPMTLDGVSFFMGESRPDRRDGRKRRFYNYVTIVAEVAGRIVLANSLELFRQALPRLKTGSPEAAVTGDQVVLDPVQLATFMRRNRETLVDLEFLSGAENRKTAAETLDRELEELNARGVLRLDFDHEGGKSRLTIHEAEGSLPR
ncbi:MAG: hypothetical protein KDB53_04110, partial [Planctomycetes bacterium]|nr:hypothetical protein [Planctomycetota bacterium]